MSFLKDYAGAMPDLGITSWQATERLRIQPRLRTLNTPWDLFVLEAMLLRQVQLWELQTTESTEVYASIYNKGLMWVEMAISEDRAEELLRTPSLKLQTLISTDLRFSELLYTFNSWF